MDLSIENMARGKYGTSGTLRSPNALLWSWRKMVVALSLMQKNMEILYIHIFLVVGTEDKLYTGYYFTPPQSYTL